MTTRKTMFGSFLQAASAVYRVTTESSIYILGFHEDRGRRYVVVRGLPGTDREHVVLRDSDPRIGQASMYEVSPEAWVGEVMEIATMTSSVVIAVQPETDRAAIASVGGDSPSAHPAWKRPTSDSAATLPPRPAGLSDAPGVRGGLGRGTSPGAAAAPRGVGHNVVTGQAPQSGGARATGEPEVPYPHRHVLYAENAATLLRAIARRDRLWEDVAADRGLRERLTKAIDDCADLLALIRHGNRR
jgi:hypothetical protein